ncbi:MAG TPA: hypothetical protein PLS67_03580 [Accumulibacter sp.]|jgi:hypothetical protein|nr:hypothetical protein [Accumulibacter sp.]HQC79589.1 hypothetical protein [Accumulibacter sp.]
MATDSLRITVRKVVLSSGVLVMGISGCLLLAAANLAAGEIIIGPTQPTPGTGSAAAQSARENRQRAAVNRLEEGSSPNIVIIDGINAWNGSSTTSPAGNSAAYNRGRANVNRLNGDDATLVVPNQIILSPAPETNIHQPYTPASQSAHENRRRAGIYRERSD